MTDRQTDGQTDLCLSIHAALVSGGYITTHGTVGSGEEEEEEG